MSISEPFVVAPSAVYAFGALCLAREDPTFVQAVADAHARHLRLRCQCTAPGAEMYVARLGSGYIVKRMPESGTQHAKHCPSFDAHVDSGEPCGPGSETITVDPTTGLTRLRLGFPLSARTGGAQAPPTERRRSAIGRSGAGLSLSDLLHLLWHQAGLDTWHPGFAGKRHWGTVRSRLLRAATRLLTPHGSVRNALFIPEPFKVEDRLAIEARQTELWSAAARRLGPTRPLRLVLSEVRHLGPGPGTSTIVTLKHLPGVPFIARPEVFSRLERCFSQQLALWRGSGDLRLMLIGLSDSPDLKQPSIVDAAVMPVSKHWIPVDSLLELQQQVRLIADGKALIRPSHARPSTDRPLNH